MLFASGKEDHHRAAERMTGKDPGQLEQADRPAGIIIGSWIVTQIPIQVGDEIDRLIGIEQASFRGDDILVGVSIVDPIQDFDRIVKGQSATRRRNPWPIADHRFQSRAR